MTDPQKSRYQSPKHKIITVVICLLGVGLLIVLGKGLSLNPSIVASAQIGKPARDFNAVLLEGGAWIPKATNGHVKLSDLQGKPLVLNFWASWCISCREEAAEMERFWQRHRESGIVVLGVAIQDTPEAAREFAKTFGKTYPIALDDNGKTSIDYGVYGVPETFFIDRNGVIVHKETGPVTAELLEKINSKFQASRSDPIQSQAYKPL